MKVLILAPRLDCSFKPGPVPETKGPPNSPIRVHWVRFINQLYTEMQSRGHNVTMWEKPMWQFTPEDVIKFDADVTYVPHREKHMFDCGDMIIQYYMQTVFPNRFTIDPLGWAGGASVSPLEPLFDGNEIENFKKYQRTIRSGMTKFDYVQPHHNERFFEKDYILFTCQIPHDLTIKHHSYISVEAALLRTLNYAAITNQFVVVKGHPVNPASMSKLKEICNGHHCMWVDRVNIHQAIEQSKMVMTVNSGTGMEALLYEKPVYTFGKSEYQNATYQIKHDPLVSKSDSEREEWTLEGYVDVMVDMLGDDPLFNKRMAEGVFNAFDQWTINSVDVNHFKNRV